MSLLKTNDNTPSSNSFGARSKLKQDQELFCTLFRHFIHFVIPMKAQGGPKKSGWTVRSSNERIQDFKDPEISLERRSPIRFKRIENPTVFPSIWYCCFQDSFPGRDGKGINFLHLDQLSLFFLDGSYQVTDPSIHFVGVFVG